MNEYLNQMHVHLKKDLPVAIIGSGPAGLMAAHGVASAGFRVQVFEKRSGLGRKILIAGSSGLNISHHCSDEEFLRQYSGPKVSWKKILAQFSPRDWLKFIEQLGLETFLGTSHRYFVRGMKGSNLLKSWVEDLKGKGVEFFLNHECVEFESDGKSLLLTLREEKRAFSAVCFCLGGGSWEKEKNPLRWPHIFISKGLRFYDFQPSNVGFQVNWTEAFLKEAEGHPLKGIRFSSKKGSKIGELVITRYGLEGTPIYALGEVGEVWLDLKPDLSEKEILTKLSRSRENLSPLRRVKKFLNLSPASLALLFHFTPKNTSNDLHRLISHLKKFPLILQGRQPLEEAISSSGGLDWNELDLEQNMMMLKRFPGVFAAGEMLNWDAPTGGFLIQGCVSQGYCAGRGMVRFLNQNSGV